MATIQLFNKPVYTKYTKSDGSTTPGYIFNVTSHIESISFNADAGQSDIEALHGCLNENKSWWHTTLVAFLSIANNYFTKKYTAEVIAKHIKHSGIDNTKYSNNLLVVFTPKYILLADNQFTMIWDVKKDDRIDVPDLEEEPQMELTLTGNAKGGLVAQNTTVSSGLEEADTDTLAQAEPLHFPTGRTHVGSGTSTIHESRHDDKRKIQEARLRAKIAHYKAEKAITRYLEKYGDYDLSSSDEESSSSGSDTS